MAVNKKLNFKEKLFVGGIVTVATIAGIWAITQTEPSKKYLRGSDFNGVSWKEVYNDSKDNVRGYFEGENIPHGDIDYYLYEMIVRQYNDNRASLKGPIKVPDVDRDGNVKIGYQTPHPNTVNRGN